MTKIYEYYIEENGEPIGHSFDLRNREQARQRLAFYKSNGHPKAKIVQVVYALQSKKNIR